MPIILFLALLPSASLESIKLGFMKKGTANVEIKIIELGDGVYMHHNE